jgi:hypothetical protein
VMSAIDVFQLMSVGVLHLIARTIRDNG